MPRSAFSSPSVLEYIYALPYCKNCVCTCVNAFTSSLITLNIPIYLLTPHPLSSTSLLFLSSTLFLSSLFSPLFSSLPLLITSSSFPPHSSLLTTASASTPIGLTIVDYATIGAFFLLVLAGAYYLYYILTKKVSQSSLVTCLCFYWPYLVHYVLYHFVLNIVLF
jgi:hypothetical protein